MLDAFKNITSGKGKLVQQQSDELEQLIATAREERSAISAMLTSLTTRSAKLTPLGKSLEQVSEKASSVTAMLDEIAKRLSALTEDYTRIREISRESREDTTAAMTTVKEVEAKLGPLARLHELSQSTEERLTTLNALAEHVTHKAKALESQQQAVEHAVVQANRVNEMVWAMDVQIAKLNEGMKQVARADDTLARTEKLAAEANAQFES